MADDSDVSLTRTRIKSKWFQVFYKVRFSSTCLRSNQKKVSSRFKASIRVRKLPPWQKPLFARVKKPLCIGYYIAHFHAYNNPSTKGRWCIKSCAKIK